MKYLPFRMLTKLAWFAALFCLLTLPALSSDPFWLSSNWRPVTPQELQMAEPKVEPGADAEAIFWETRLDDRNSTRLTIEHYVRVKIFTERGRERFSKLEIPFMKGKRITDVAARSIRPDGTITELRKEDVFEQEIARRGKIRVLAKSFAMPGIEVGSIVEYQYTEISRDDSVAGERLFFQRDIPMQQVTYYVRPYGRGNLTYHFYNLPEMRFSDDRRNWQVATLYDVPAYKDEPYMPPDDEVRRWVYVSYTTLRNILVWPLTSGAWGEVFKQSIRSNKDIRAKATELTAGASTDDEKLRRLYTFAQTGIRNINYDTTMTDEERDRHKIRDAQDAYKRGLGTSIMINLLFASMAKSLGYEVNMVLAPDRSDTFFNPDKYPFRNFVQPSAVGVKVRNDWRFFSPGVPFLGFEQQLWYREGVNSMLIGEDGSYIWKRSSTTAPQDSNAKRSTKLTLAEDGTVSGRVTIEFSGHQAIERRRFERRDSQAKREENFREEIKEKISTAEITNLNIQNFENNDLPIIYTFDIKIPNYAQRTGRRLLVQPGLFEYGSDPYFSSSERTYGVYFEYPWSQTDEVILTFPEGFELDQADRPRDLIDSQAIGRSNITMNYDSKNRQLIYRRNFHFGAGGHVFFPREAYPVIKQMFDEFHQASVHTISLKPSES